MHMAHFLTRHNDIHAKPGNNPIILQYPISPGGFSS
jgi:hypothetical protein